jgi:hypothetical protein
MSASIPSWITSVYTVRSSNSESSSPYSTALATFPVPPLPSMVRFVSEVIDL